jgi:beta-galactosidase
MKSAISFSIVLILGMTVAASQTQRHTFVLGEKDFLLDGKPLQMISGEMHPARIPREYWRQRVQMAKAMGCNTVAAYIFCHSASRAIRARKVASVPNFPPHTATHISGQHSC